MTNSELLAALSKLPEPDFITATKLTDPLGSGTYYSAITVLELIEGKSARVAILEQWLQWCLDNCDDSPEYNFGTDATDMMRAFLQGEDVSPPIKHRP